MNKSNKIIGGCGIALGLVLALIVACPRLDVVHAEGVQGRATPALSSADELPTPSIAVALDATADLVLLPSADGQADFAAAKLKVAAKNTNGYKIYLSAADSRLVRRVNNEAESIANIGQPTALVNFAKNTWGIYLGETLPTSGATFLPVSEESTKIYDANTTEGNYFLIVGARVDESLPAGLYSNALTVSVVANPRVATTWEETYYLQDMTTSICENASEGSQRQLFDKRDNKKYWIERMKDGNCWMVQNLALDLVGGKTYTVEDTDLEDTESKSWTVPENRSTETEIPAPGDGNINDVRSWDLGEIILTNPTGSHLCPSATAPNDGFTYPPYTDISAYHGQKLANNCPAYYKDVTGWSATYTSLSNLTYNNGAKTYDPRYLIGNYYQFNTATAGTAIGLTSPESAGTDVNALVNASGSICPKGWTLPKAGREIASTGISFDIDKSFYGLLSRYGYNGGWAKDTAPYYDGYMALGQGTNLMWSPLFFTKAGCLSAEAGVLRSAGSEIDVWSQTLFPDGWPSKGGENAYSLLVSVGSQVRPSFRYGKTYGFNVRCVSR